MYISRWPHLWTFWPSTWSLKLFIKLCMHHEKISAQFLSHVNVVCLTTYFDFSKLPPMLVFLSGMLLFHKFQISYFPCLSFCCRGIYSCWFHPNTDILKWKCCLLLPICIPSLLWRRWTTCEAKIFIQDIFQSLSTTSLDARCCHRKYRNLSNCPALFAKQNIHF